MATYSKLPSGTWRVQIRSAGRYISETFLKRDDARRWATETEGRIDRGDVPSRERAARLRTFGDLVDLHIATLHERCGFRLRANGPRLRKRVIQPSRFVPIEDSLRAPLDEDRPADRITPSGV